MTCTKRKMKNKSNIPEYGTPAWGLYQYKRMKEENRGHNYQYYNHEKWLQMEANGWQMWDFNDKMDRYATRSEYYAKACIIKLKTEGNHARIIAGYSQNRQRIKMFTVIYKKKKQCKV